MKVLNSYKSYIFPQNNNRKNTFTGSIQLK